MGGGVLICPPSAVVLSLLRANASFLGLCLFSGLVLMLVWLLLCLVVLAEAEGSVQKQPPAGTPLCPQYSIILTAGATENAANENPNGHESLA